MSVVISPPITSKTPFFTMKGDHAAIRVPDFAGCKRCFVKKLDFRVVHEWPYGDLQLAYVAPPADDHFRIEILGGGHPEEKPSYTDLADSLRLAGYHHICLSVQNVDDAVAELRRRDVKIVTEPFNLPAINRRLAFFADPWGNLFELAEVLPS